MSKILIVDDSPTLRRTMRIVLEKSGFNVIGEAGNDRETEDMLTKDKPDMVLLDVLMPGKSGLDVLKDIKAKYTNIKVLMVTAVNQDKVNLEAKNLGASGILYKPFDPLELVNAVKEVLK